MFFLTRGIRHGGLGKLLRRGQHTTTTKQRQTLATALGQHEGQHPTDTEESDKMALREIQVRISSNTTTRSSVSNTERHWKVWARRGIVGVRVSPWAGQAWAGFRLLDTSSPPAYHADEDNRCRRQNCRPMTRRMAARVENTDLSIVRRCRPIPEIESPPLYPSKPNPARLWASQMPVSRTLPKKSIPAQLPAAERTSRYHPHWLS